MITRDIVFECEEVKSSTTHSSNKVKVELVGLTDKEIVDTVLSSVDADYLAGRVCLEHLSETLQALKEIEVEIALEELENE